MHKEFAVHSHHNNSLHWVSALVFLIIAIGHATRAVLGMPMIMGDYSVPMFVSIIAAIVFAALAYWNFCATRCCGHNHEHKSE
jgi:hypothetical protein